MSREELISQCLNGERDRHCEYCPAHAARGGDCCFGRRHEYGDPDCGACALNEQCAVQTHRVTTNSARTNQKIIYPNNSPAKIPVQSAHIPSYDRPRDNGPILTMARPTSSSPFKLRQEDPFLVQLVQVGLWGAMEGMFELMLGFMRKKRPE